MKHTIMLIAVLSIGLAFQTFSPAGGVFSSESVRAADILTDTYWTDVNSEFDFVFKGQGKATHNIYGDEFQEGESLQGTYKLNGKTVEMSFDNNKIIVSATINGTTMKGRIYINAEGFDFQANKK